MAVPAVPVPADIGARVGDPSIAHSAAAQTAQFDRVRGGIVMGTTVFALCSAGISTGDPAKPGYEWGFHRTAIVTS
jgi:hypothetical protein